MRSGAVALLSCFTPIVCSAAWAVEPPPARRGIAEDASGNVVLDEAGERHSFGRDVLAARAAASAPRAASRLAPPANTSLATEGPYTLDFARTFEFSIWGTSIGRSGMIPVDLDGDGARNDEPVSNNPRACRWQKPWAWLSSGGTTPRCVAQ